MIHKKISALFSSLALTAVVYAQQPPQGTPGPGAFWRQGGNTGGPGAPNIFGTTGGNNNPIYTVTNGVNRTRLNGTLMNNYLGTGFMHDVSGHFGIGLNGYFNNNTPLTMLHLEGPNNTNFTGGQFRTWMRTGMFARENSGAMYVGLKSEGFNRSDAVVNWSDDSGADKLRFLFTGTLLNLPGVVNPLRSDSQNGYEFMRMHASGPVNEAGTNAGYIGIGPLFTDALTPQSRLHMNAESGLATFLQISNVPGGGLPGTGQTATDGLKLGLQNFIAPTGSRQYGYLQWQENTPFIIQTDWDNTSGGVAGGERLRITSIGSILNNFNASQYNGLTSNTNVTRIAISHQGNIPLTRPKSLLHIGYDYGNTFGTIQGYRQWMDLGLLTSNSRDHVWLGLQPRDSLINTVTQNYDRNDAVMAWGTDRNVNSPAEVDKMRFVFTGNIWEAAPEISPGNSWHGLEMMRMYPATVYQHYLYDTTGNISDSVQSYGRVGIGDFTWSGVNEEPTQKLDVVGNGRFRYLPDSIYMADTSVNKIVMVDSNGVLRWKSYFGDFGYTCDADSSTYFNEHRKVTLNQNNFYFETNDLDSLYNNVGFGYPCGTFLKAKVDVIQSGIGGVGGSFFTITNNSSHGVRGMAHTTDTTYGLAVGVLGSTAGPDNAIKYGIKGVSSGTPNSWAGYFDGDLEITNGAFISSDQQFKTSVNTLNGSLNKISKLRPVSYYMDTANYEQFKFDSKLHYGFIAQEVEQLFPNIVRNSVNAGSYDSVGNFTSNPVSYKSLNYDAIIPINTQAIIELNQKVEKATLSDQSIKTNVQDLTGSLDKVLNMHGVSYDWNHTIHPELNLDSANHVGFIAQEIAQIDARLTYMADDSLLHVEYDKVVPILAEAIQELNDSIATRDSIISAQGNQIEDLNNRLSQLENCLSGILPYLCQLSQSAVQANTPQSQEAIRAQLEVKLSNREAIILDQNVPNPFAEQTVINFSIPETVKKAQIHFYNGTGQLMQSVDVTERGLGSLTVFGSDLSSGTYTYTLVADGVVVATKKMVKQ